MVEAQKILEMIEGVDPEDTKTLDEIDIRVEAYKKNMKIIAYPHRVDWGDKGGVQYYHNMATVDHKDMAKLVCYNKYTRSRDALKKIRPDGYIHGGHDDDDPQKFKFEFVTKFPCKAFVSRNLPTEELAELHCIIQAIQWERENGQ